MSLTFNRITNGVDVLNGANKHLGKIVWHGCQGEFVFVPDKEVPYFYIAYMGEILTAMRLLQDEREKMVEIVGI